MTFRASELMPKGRAALERSGQVVAFGSINDMARAYRGSDVLIVSRNDYEGLCASLAKDVTPLSKIGNRP